MVHRVSHDLFIFGRTEDLRRIASSKVAGDFGLQEIGERSFIFDDAMAGHAAHAVTRQRAVDVRLVRRLIVVSGVDHLWIEITFAVSTVIVVEPAFTHDAMTFEARVIDGFDLLRNFGRIVFEETLDERNLAFELRIEDGIATSQSHWRPTPLAEWRNVHHGR